MTINLIPITQALAKAAAKILVYGFAGAGKTFLAASLKGPGLLISAEAGTLSLKKAIEEGVFHAGTKVLTLTPGPQALQELAELLADLRRDPDKFAWVMLDSISEIAEVALAGESEKNTNPLQAYGKMALAMLKLMKDFRDLPGVDVVFSAKAELEVDSATGKKRITVKTPGKKFPADIPYLFDEVLYLTVAPNGERAFFTQDPDLLGTAKDRSGQLDPYEEVNKAGKDGSWGLGRVIDKIKGKE